MATPEFSIRPLRCDEATLPLEWAAAEGWNPGRHDAACFFEADPAGFLVGMVDDEPVATIAVVRYGTAFGFLGLYIVRAAFRGQGYGLRIWNAGMAHLAGRNVGLDGVVAQQDNYRKSGFALAYRNIRYQGIGGAHGPVDPRVVPVASLPVAATIAYDRQCFPEDRRAFLERWLLQPESTALCVVGEDGLAGYGVVRAAVEGCKVGPLFADGPDIAEALFNGLLAHVPRGANVYLDTPDANPAAIAMAQRHRMRTGFETARMYTGPAPTVPLHRIFGVTTFELG